MIGAIPQGFVWPAPWLPIRDKDGNQTPPRILGEVHGERDPESFLIEELRRELCPDHVLHGRTCTPVAQHRHDPNEFVFITDQPDYPIAVVHLTWQPEKCPAFPRTWRYRSLEDFEAESRHAL